MPDAQHKRSRRQVRRKNFRLDQAKLDTARRLLGTATETQTIERALDLVVFRNAVLRGLRRLAGHGGLRDIYRANKG